MPGGQLEKIFYQCPPLVQNIAFSLYGIKLRRERYGKSFRYVLDWLKGSQWWTKEEVESYSNEKFVKAVNDAYHLSPFYRNLYDSYGITPKKISSLNDIKKIPILTKDSVRHYGREMVSSMYKEKELIVGLTSGSTGRPLKVCKTRQAVAFQWAIWWRHKSRFDLHPSNPHLTVGARVPVRADQKDPPFWRYDFFNNRVYLSSYHISCDTIEEILGFLEKKKFSFFTGYPSSLFLLADSIEKAGLVLENKPKYIITGSDQLTESYERKIHEVLGAPVSEQYGMAEFAGNLSKCEFGNFHIDFECCHVEALSTDSPGIKKLVLTGWGNPAMPFIRYEVGDTCSELEQGCSCGRQSLFVRHIFGREEDFIYLPDGRRLMGMNQVFEYAECANDVQAYQNDQGCVEFRIVPGDGFGEKDIASLRREFLRRSGNQVKCTFTTVDALETTGSGKRKAVISDFKEFPE